MKTGEIFTPKNIVNLMLDEVGYNGNNILEKRVIDNSAGEGAFLQEVLRRYIAGYKKEYGTLQNIEKHLSKYIRGIELNKTNYDILIKNMNNILKEYKIDNVKWDIVNGDTIELYKKYLMNDFVVGNPPYIRIHDMEKVNEIKKKFTAKGMFDLYIIFYNIGINMLNKNGKLIYITPNSFFQSSSAQEFRKRLVDNKMIKSIINLGHYNPFINATTYTAIMQLDLQEKEYFKFQELDENGLKNVKYYTNSSFYIDNKFFFLSDNDLKFINQIYENQKTTYRVKNGVATNLDTFFHKKRNLNIKNVVKNYKISTGEYGTSFFPYTEDGLITYTKLSSKIKLELKDNEEKLKKRSLQKQKWYEYARTQGIKDTFKKRVCINNIVKNVEDLKIEYVEENVVVYSGYYIVINSYEEFLNIKNILLNIEFIEYVKKLNKEKNGEYFFYSSIDLEKYLNYKLLEGGK